MFSRIYGNDEVCVYLNGVLQENVDRADAVLGYVDLIVPDETMICPVNKVEIGKRVHLDGEVKILFNGVSVVAVN
jgi:hypothetical protein